MPGSYSKRSCSTVLPATSLAIEKLPWSNVKVQQKMDCGKQGNLKEGLTARYNVFGDTRKWNLVSLTGYVAPHQFTNLFEKLRAATI